MRKASAEPTVDGKRLAELHKVMGREGLGEADFHKVFGCASASLPAHRISEALTWAQHPKDFTFDANGPQAGAPVPKKNGDASTSNVTALPAPADGVIKTGEPLSTAAQALNDAALAQQAAQVEEQVHESPAMPATRVAEKSMLEAVMLAAVEPFRNQNKTWFQMTEQQQAGVLSRVHDGVRQALARGIDIIVADDRPVMRAKVDSVTFKDGVKIILKAETSSIEAHSVAEYQGKSVKIVLEDGNRYLVVGAALKTEPNQSSLPLTADNGTKPPEKAENGAKPLRPVSVERDAQGYWTHPDLPEIEDGQSGEEVLADLGFEAQPVLMLETAEHEVIDRYERDGSGEPTCSDWEPSEPDGNGWFLISIHDSEEGPVALFARAVEAA